MTNLLASQTCSISHTYFQMKHPYFGTDGRTFFAPSSSVWFLFWCWAKIPAAYCSEWDGVGWKWIPSLKSPHRNLLDWGEEEGSPFVSVKLTGTLENWLRLVIPKKAEMQRRSHFIPTGVECTVISGAPLFSSVKQNMEQKKLSSSFI